jgi:hypothetical protein
MGETLLAVLLLSTCLFGCSSPSQRTTDADFGQVQTGMSMREVIEKFGEPTDKVEGTHSTILVYRRGAQVVTIQMKDGTVTSVVSSGEKSQ